MGIEIGLSNIKTTKSVQNNSIDIEISDIETTNIVEPDPIYIEISGLKTIDKFIGLEDTPLYYENGKFFKVENNRIIYTDISWSDIGGDITQNPELSNEVLRLVEENAKKFTESAVSDGIRVHNSDLDAHPFIQADIDNKYIELTSKLTSTNVKVDNNTQDIKDLTQSVTSEILDINEHINNVEIKTDNNTIGVQNLNQELQNTNLNVDNNTIGIQNLNQELQNTNTNVEKNTTDISNLNQQVIDDYNELNQLINNNSEAIISNTESIQTNIENIATNSQLINDTIENLKEYSKTSEFANIAFSGLYSDLLEVPDNLATTQYVDKKVNDAIGTITGFDFLVVDQLPETGEAGHIYLVPHQQSDKNIYDEYIWVQDSINFELIGTTEIDLSNYYTKEESDSSYGAKLVYNNSTLTLQTKDDKELTSVTIKSTPDVDDTTIHLNNSEQLEVIGNVTKDGTTKYDWIGTKEEYEQGLSSGLITSSTICYITDDKEQLIIKPDLNVPTKLSELANDSGFIANSNLIEFEVDNTTIKNNNGIIYATGVTEYNNLLNKPSIPSKTSDLVNDNGFISGIPDEYVTDLELQSTLSNYQLKSNKETTAIYLGDDFNTTYGTIIETMTLTGGSYNTMTTELVIPVDGYYVVSVSLLLKDTSRTAGRRILCNLLLNTNTACAQSTVTTQTTNANNLCTLTSIVKCNVNDKLTMQIANGLTTNLEIELLKFSAVKIC